MAAVKYNRCDMIQLLLDSKADVNAVDANEQTPLIDVIRNIL